MTLSKWKQLPFEILYEIFQIANEPKYLAHTQEYALVCKTWVKAAQTVLYSDVAMTSLQDFKKFHKTVQQNFQLGNMVKILELNICSRLNMDQHPHDNTALIVIELLTDLITTCLPQLEKLLGMSLDSYSPILNALENSHLQYLKRIASPHGDLKQSEIDNYRACVLLLKDRIEQISVTFPETTDLIRETFSKKLQSDRIFTELNQFSKLTELHIDIKILEEIQTLELVIENCKSLTKLSFSLSPPDPLFEGGGEFEQNYNVSTNAISNYVPTSHIKSLKTKLIVWDEEFKILSYLLHKFPDLESLDISFRIYSFKAIDNEILAQILQYSSRIDDFNADTLCVSGSALQETIKNHWESTSAPGKEIVQFIYMEALPEEDEFAFDFAKSDNSTAYTTTIGYPEIGLDTLYKQFLEGSGKYIGELMFDFTVENSNSARCELPETFMMDALTYCPNLRKIHVKRCILKQLDNLEIDSSIALSIEELFIDHCIIYPGALEQLSILLPNIKRLRFCATRYRKNKHQSISLGRKSADLDPQIIMQHSKIDKVIIHDGLTGLPDYIKVFTVSDEKYHYYRYDTKFWESNEQEYNTSIPHLQHINICCQTVPEIRFEGIDEAM